MSGELLLAVVIALGVLSYGIITATYLKEWLFTAPIQKPLELLIALHFFRYVGLTFLLPEAASGPLPAIFAYPAALGDLLSAVLAMVAFFAVRNRARAAVSYVWAFNIVGTLDLAYAFSAAMLSGAAGVAGGAVWWIPTIYVPALIISHFIIFALLLKKYPTIQHA